VTLTRSSNGLFSELKCAIAAKLQVEPEKIESIQLSGSDVVIEDDRDVLQLREDELLEVVLKA